MAQNTYICSKTVTFLARDRDDIAEVDRGHLANTIIETSKILCQN